MTHASLFSGIGGFDLAAEWMGWDNIFHCEWNPFGQKVLAHHFPNSKSYNDITKTDFSLHAGQIDILTGGFPCQPYSQAGKRLGKADERHLFPHMLRCIKEVKPKWVIGENVRGLVNWNGGMVFHEVCDDLEREGYEVQPFLIPAAGVNAPHQRQRIWFVAYCKDFGCLPTKTINERKEYISNDRNGIRTIFESNGEIWNASDTKCVGLEFSKKKETFIKAQARHKAKGVNLQNPLKQMAVNMNPSGSTSQLNPLFVEEMMGFPKNWTTLPFLNGKKNQSKPTETQ